MGVSAIICFGLSQVFKGKQSIGDFSSSIIAVLLLYQPLKRLSRVQSQINQIAGTAGRVFDLLAQKTDIQIPIKIQPICSAQNLKLQFKEACFYYEKNSKPALQNLNLQIEEGEKIGIIGPSGSGKSTISKLIPRLYDLTSGSLQIKGVDVRNWDLFKLRSLISFVPQETFLFSGSLRDNLLLAKPNASETDLSAALNLAEIDFIHSLDELVWERGLNFSGGQRQRIGIARAFLRNSPLLILDEPTSSLDSHTEELITNNLQILCQNRTVILITHKLVNLQNFERIIHLEDGVIKSQEG